MNWDCFTSLRYLHLYNNKAVPPPPRPGSGSLAGSYSLPRTGVLPVSLGTTSEPVLVPADYYYVLHLSDLIGTLPKPQGVFWSQHTFSECLPRAEGRQAVGPPYCLCSHQDRASSPQDTAPICWLYFLPLQTMPPPAPKLATWENCYYLGPSISAYKSKPRILLEKALYEMAFLSGFKEILLST